MCVHVPCTTAGSQKVKIMSEWLLRHGISRVQEWQGTQVASRQTQRKKLASLTLEAQ